MQLLNLLIISVCCFSYLAQCAIEQQQLQKQGATEAKKDTDAQSAIFRIKRLELKDMLTKPQQHKQKKVQQLQKQKHQQIIEEHVEAIASKPQKTKKFKNLARNSSHDLNKKLLSKLGFTKVKAPNSHNRKRLAIESRRHASPDDSHMFIIKLPPSMHYYSNPQLTNSAAGDVEAAAPAMPAIANPQNALLETAEHKKMLSTNGKKVSFPFNSNGKPGRVYHWNLPVIKKILEDKQRFPKVVATATKDQLIDIKDIPTWTKPWENDTVEKSYGKSSMTSYKKSLKRKSPSYYAPTHAVNKSSFNKYFPGNGKPKGFYVIKENQKKPLYFKNIVS